MAAAFKNATPKDQIGGSALLVYEGDFDTSLDAATGERNLATHAHHPTDSSTPPWSTVKRAVELAPASALAHGNLCVLLAPTRLDLALKECYVAQNLLLHDPLRDEASSKVLPGLTCEHPYGAQK